MFIQQQMTAEEYLAFAERYPDKRFDFIDGEIVEVSPKPLHGRIQTILAAALEAYTQKNRVGLVYTEVLHVLGDDKYIPDVCINQASDADYLTTPPLMAVEIRSDSQSRKAQRQKAQEYIAHGVRMAVLILPGESIEIYQPDRDPQILGMDAVLDGGDVLPGFTIVAKELLKI